jgi:hypothetical protein
MPRLGATYDIEIEVISKPNAEYLTDEYFALDFPVAPAVMVENEILVEGKDIDDYMVEVAICRRLGLPEPEPEAQKKGVMARLFGK